VRKAPSGFRKAKKRLKRLRVFIKKYSIEIALGSGEARTSKQDFAPEERA